jgi:hypothetical protein
MEEEDFSIQMEIFIKETSKGMKDMARVLCCLRMEGSIEGIG